MADNQQSRAQLAKLPDALKTLVLKIRITNRQRLIHDQHIRPLGGGQTESKTHLHATGIHPHRLVDVIANFCKSLNLRHQRRYFRSTEPNQLPRHESVLATREIRVKTHTQL